MGGVTAGAPRAREIMKVLLLKDAEMRERMKLPDNLQVAGL